MPAHEKLNYVEFPAQDLAQTRAFFQQVFNWQFTDYGPEYTAFDNQGLEGGFYQSPLAASTINGSALLVFYSEQLEQTKEKIETAGGEIIKPIFKVPLNNDDISLAYRCVRNQGSVLKAG